MNRRARHVWGIARQGPTEAGYAFFRARRRRRNRADTELALSESDRLALAGHFDLSPAQETAHRAGLEAQARAPAVAPRTVLWFLPFFHLAAGGGIHTVLRFADHFAREHGVRNHFCLYDRDSARVAGEVGEKVAAAFPALSGAPVTPAGAPLPQVDLALATAWESAFALARFTGARRRVFFVQDDEPSFHPAGAASAMLERAAHLGLPGVVNSPGLADVYRARGNVAVSFFPAVDTTRYRPAGGPRGAGRTRVFFYGRPGNPRNAFGLGLAALRQVRERHGEDVEIVSAGEDWSPGQYGVADVLANAGMLEDLDAVARLYRSCDIGLCFMVTPHPSYLPLELMASGAAVVSNQNPHTGWLLRHEHNALLAPAAPAAVAGAVSRLVGDPELRARLTQEGLRTAAATRWEDEMERVWRAIAAPQAEAFTAAPELGPGAPAPPA